MRWKGIPSQVKAFDDNDEVSEMLSTRFQELIDATAMADGSLGSDTYLDHWAWDEVKERDGDVREALDAVVAELEAQGPQVAA